MTPRDTTLLVLLGLLAAPIAGCAQTPATPDQASRAVLISASASVEPTPAPVEREVLLEAPAPAPDPWTAIETTSGATDFVDLDRGVLMRVGEDAFVLEDGELVAAPAKALRRSEIRGVWPDDAWAVRTLIEERAGFQIQLSKWRGNTRWAAQPIASEDSDVIFETDSKWYEMGSDWWGRPGGRGGYLLGVHDYDADAIEFFRVAGKHYAPAPLAWPEELEGWPRDIYEAPSGRLFVFHSNGDETGVIERARCRTHCKLERVELPDGLADHELREFVARPDDQLTASVSEGWDGDAPTKLLHRDRDGWSFEDAPLAGATIERMVAIGEDLFVILVESEDAQLWRRGAEGAWAPVELPRGAAPAGEDGLDLAVTDAGNLWLAVNGAEQHAVYELTLAPAATAPAPAEIGDEDA